jgi:hypothetical protein
MLSEILQQACFSKLEKERREGKVRNVKLKDFAFDLTDGFEDFEIHPSQPLHDPDNSNCLLQHAFRNLATGSARVFKHLIFDRPA